MSIDIKENNLSIKSRYRPEIDGLRAFAVIAVIMNHFNKDILPGGYLGVDIFFVISGFVITSSLYQRPNENFSDFIIGFYERRIKRLLPALSVFVLITSIAICFFNPEPVLTLRTGLTSLFGLSNIYLLRRATDYFAQSAELNVFTHTWSLGVEEQFYILFPFLVWFSGFGRQTKKGALNLFLIVGALTIGSLIGFLYLYQSNQPAAYFLMPTRFWEMAAGCLIFILLQKRTSIEKLLEKVPPLLLLLLIVGVMYLPISLASVSTFAIVIFSAILISSLKKGTTSYTIFTHPKLIYIGRISYSLYLWHWGVLSTSRWTIGIHWWSVPFQVALMFGLAIASYRYIETPIRKGNLSFERWKTLYVGGGVIIALSGGLIALEKPLKKIIYLGNLQYDKHQYKGLSKCNGEKNFDLKIVSNCILSSKNGRNILSIGDSQTRHLRPLLNKLHNDDGFGIFYYSNHAHNFPSLIETRNTPYQNDANRFRESFKKSTLAFFDYYFAQLKKGDIIFLSSRYELRWGESPIPELERNIKFTFYDSNNKILSRDQSFNKWKSLFDEIAQMSLSKGVKVIVFNTIPTFPNNFFLQGKQWFNSLNNQIISNVKRDELINNSRLVDSALNSLADRHDNVEVFDVFSELCPESQDFCTSEKHSDQTHISKSASLSLYEGLLKKLN